MHTYTARRYFRPSVYSRLSVCHMTASCDIEHVDVTWLDSKLDNTHGECAIRHHPSIRPSVCYTGRIRQVDLLWCATIRRLHGIGSDLVKPSALVKDNGIHLNANLSMRCHVQKTTAICFAVLR